MHLVNNKLSRAPIIEVFIAFLFQNYHPELKKGISFDGILL